MKEAFKVTCFCAGERVIVCLSFEENGDSPEVFLLCVVFESLGEGVVCLAYVGDECIVWIDVTEEDIEAFSFHPFLWEFVKGVTFNQYGFKSGAIMNFDGLE